MFQNFEDSSQGMHGAARLELLREKMRERGVDGFIVPLADAHQGEYVAPCDARLAWLTGFTGSAGFAVILANSAGVFIDGRYRVQVRGQIDLDVYTPVDWPATSIPQWLTGRIDSGSLAYDPWLHTAGEIDKLRDALSSTEIRLTPTENLVDAIWQEQPGRPVSQIRIHALEHSGKSHTDKRHDLAEELRERGFEAAVLTLADSSSWLLNIRGSDIARNPVVQAFSILYADGRVDLFTSAGAGVPVHDHLGPEVSLLPREEFLPKLSKLRGEVLIDKGSVPDIVRDRLAHPVAGLDPCALPKARKNDAEIAGARAAHLRDGVAVVQFLHWFDSQTGPLTEIDCARKMEECRTQTGQLLDISFDTISSTGPHGAINHYRVNEASNRTLREGELFLIDSGGQYVDGTTDITRTLPVGTPSEEHRFCYSRVLRGLIALSQIRFPRGVSGADLDVLARAPLWQAGLDFDHGTGHGVGSYLCVHEGPQRISRLGGTPFDEGMILSNEPGYYREGEFGIRLENLIVVRKAPKLNGQDDRDWLDFETLAYVPFDRRLIDVGDLCATDIEWIDGYHERTLARLAPHLGADARAWLQRACAPLGV